MNIGCRGPPRWDRRGAAMRRACQCRSGSGRSRDGREGRAGTGFGPARPDGRHRVEPDGAQEPGVVAPGAGQRGWLALDLEVVELEMEPWTVRQPLAGELKIEAVVEARPVLEGAEAWTVIVLSDGRILRAARVGPVRAGRRERAADAGNARGAAGQPQVDAGDGPVKAARGRSDQGHRVEAILDGLGDLDVAELVELGPGEGSATAPPPPARSTRCRRSSSR